MVREALASRLPGIRPLALGSALAVAVASAAVAQNAVQFSPDITAELGSVGPTTVTDEEVAVHDAAGTVTALAAPGLGAIPANADVNGYHLMPTGDKLVSLDITVMLPGLPVGMPAEPRDVLLFDPMTSVFSFFFDGSTAAAGVPANARVDAVTLNPLGELLLSFDISVSLPGLGPVDDEDVVSFAAGVYTMEFDGSANGVSTALDVDAADVVLGTGELLISFNASGTVGGVVFDDEDVVAFDATVPSFAMYFDASTSGPADPDWVPTDIIALPEPGVGVSMLAGLACLALLRRIRGV